MGGISSHLLITGFLFLFILALLLPVENLINYLKIKCTKLHLLVFISIFIFILFLKVKGVSFITQFFLSAVYFLGFLIEFFMKKKNLYLLILGSLFLVLILTLINLKNLADQLSAIVYLIIGVGALKTFFYDKIFK